ncbi:MAG: radical SAM protein [Candidatus Omnitrophica bacterium]|nr:radical SAM protein [Candidatus Omnitrophota bacterium]
MPIIYPVIRPPSEAGNFLLQVTSGCSDNNCKFCAAYKNKRFFIKTEKEISEDICFYSQQYPDTRRVFLLDGDALVLPYSRMISVLDELSSAFSLLSRVSSYANGYNLLKLSLNQLITLRKRKLSLVYIGLESGSENVLKYCGKKTSAAQISQAVLKAKKAGIKSSVMVILGLGGKAFYREHVFATQKILNQIQPRYLSLLTLMVVKGTPLADEAISGKFIPLSNQEILQQAYNIILGLELEKTIFRCNHASNFIALEGRLPHDKNKILSILKSALEGKVELIDERLRCL